MELLVISENKIKISLTKNDLDGYSITCDGIDYDNTETRRVFWSLLDEAKHKTGFDAARSKIFVQIYPDKDGGCELYVSKLKKPENEKKVLFELNEKPEKSEVFGFENVKALLSACRRLRENGYSGTSDAFFDGAQRFYLVLSSSSDENGFLSEYGVKHRSPDVRIYIGEHCRRFCLGDAVEKLSVL